ncbi:glycerol channel [Massospora cicadina]|nr:glycerol channel [Massospora cicadina]
MASADNEITADKEFAVNVSGGGPEGGFETRREGYAKIRYAFREYFAEFLGTLLLVLLGIGVNAQATFNPAAKGSSFLSVNLGWALAIICAILVAGPVSGAHLNPAVTIANAALRKFPWFKVPGYALAQLLGAFVGAAVIYVIYWPAFNAFDEGVRMTVGKTATAGVFATFPFNGAPQYASFITEFISTAILLLGILGITDPRHKIPTYAAAVCIGLVLGAIGFSTGMMTGYAMNPARDLGPRLFTLLAGWGISPFVESNCYFWVPIVAPILGAIAGIFVYDVLIFKRDL